MNTNDSKCGRPCPDHGDRCSVVRGSKSDAEMAKRMFGASMDFKTHLHLCIAGGKPHGWRGREQ